LVNQVFISVKRLKSLSKFNNKGVVMYGGKGSGGAASVVGGSIVLPNTNGHLILLIVALTSITVGSVILLSILVRWLAKISYK
jgi:hypothetical protein